uniref:Uncharacterized protein n=1 Tax=Arundo donax TaxID=35708 RepID=A0A0A9G148_ARUDO
MPFPPVLSSSHQNRIFLGHKLVASGWVFCLNKCSFPKVTKRSTWLYTLINSLYTVVVQMCLE